MRKEALQHRQSTEPPHPSVERMSLAGRLTPPLRKLLGLARFGIKPGLSTIGTLTAELGAPQEAYRSILVAGTNGKGSIVAMVDQSLRASGYRVGRYTSPHLINLTERFVVDGTPISEADLTREAERLFRKIDRLLETGQLLQPPTFFEATTALALDYFCRQHVAIAVLEVGLGGRLDATNIVAPIAGVITPIALDHEQYLGNRLEAIAVEKAGIIKPGMVVITSETRHEIITIFKEICLDRGARLVQSAQDTLVRRQSLNTPTDVHITTPRRAYPACTLALAGDHQHSNAAAAVRLLEELGHEGIAVGEEAILKGVAEVNWPGRLDLVRVSNRRSVLLDAAHNPSAASALAAHLRSTIPQGVPLVMGVMGDKDLDGIVSPLLPYATRIICTAPRADRAIPPVELADRVRQLTRTIPVSVEEDTWAATEEAWRYATLICVTGSIFLVGEVMTAIKG